MINNTKIYLSQILNCLVEADVYFLIVSMNNVQTQVLEKIDFKGKNAFGIWEITKSTFSIRPYLTIKDKFKAKLWKYL